MNAWIKNLTVAGLVAAAGLTAGCRETREAEVETERELGTGGSGEMGDDKIGNNEGVLNDGEGPLEENRDEAIRNDAERTADDNTIGRREGVLDDGEGPLEERNEDVNKNENIGKKPGVLNDGEGPIENNQ